MLSGGETGKSPGHEHSQNILVLQITGYSKHKLPYTFQKFQKMMLNTPHYLDFIWAFS
mgnify:CR=1 FL=1